MAGLPECPPTLKAISHYLKTAQEHENRDLVVAYWCRIYALQMGLKLSTHQPEETKLLCGIMDWLENTKKSCNNESITNDVAGQAYLENYTLKLFNYADKQDRASNFGKNVVKAFYTAGILYDVMLTFGEMTEEVDQNRKYAKYKAAYIHRCLKNGEQPVPGPLPDQAEDEEEDELNNLMKTTNEPAPATSGGPQMGFNLPGATPPAAPSSSADTPIDTLSEKLPTPPSEPEKPPGGFKPFVPSADQPEAYVPPKAGVSLTSDQMTKAQKYCKWAGSALNYDDIPTAIQNLQKALKLLQTGQDS